jgi:competence protein ComEA
MHYQTDSSSFRTISRLFITGIFLSLMLNSDITGIGLGRPALQGRTLPEGVGRVETQKLCTQCHELDKSIAPRQDKTGWARTVEKMVAFGMTATEAEVGLVVEFLAKNYPAEEVPRIRVNQAAAIDFESAFGLRRSQASAIIKYREANGPFKSIDDLKKVPGIDAAKIEAKKDRLIFE